MMEIIVGGRRCGKTEACLEWVDGAQRIKGYPFWDRVLLCVHQPEADRLRKELRKRAAERGETDPAGLIYNKVYYVEEWKTARVGASHVDLMLDNADIYLQHVLTRGRGGLHGITLTGIAAELSSSDVEESDEKR